MPILSGFSLIFHIIFKILRFSVDCTRISTVQDTALYVEALLVGFFRNQKRRNLRPCFYDVFVVICMNHLSCNLEVSKFPWSIFYLFELASTH